MQRGIWAKMRITMLPKYQPHIKNSLILTHLGYFKRLKLSYDYFSMGNLIFSAGPPNMRQTRFKFKKQFKKIYFDKWRQWLD